jgi:hypothetical protein
MSAERPTKHDGLGYTQFVEQFDGSIRNSRSRVTALRIGRVAGLPVTRQIERDVAVILRALCLHLIAENATADRIAMDQQRWYAVLSTLLDCEEAVRWAMVLPSRDLRAGIVLFTEESPIPT